MAILKAININKYFSGTIALKDINVSIDKNEFIGIIGSNGAGKTTFVNIITGYLKPDEGKVIYNNEDITHYKVEKLVKMGIRRSFQLPQLFLNLTALDNILIAETLLQQESLSYHKLLNNDERKQRCLMHMEDFGLTDYKDNVVSMLPQGIKKLLDVCMSTLGDSKIIILDEPTSGVAAEEKIPLMDKIFQVVSKMDSTCLFIEHDMELIERYSKRVIAFHDGVVIADDNVNRVFNDESVTKYITG